MQRPRWLPFSIAPNGPVAVMAGILVLVLVASAVALLGGTRPVAAPPSVTPMPTAPPTSQPTPTPLPTASPTPQPTPTARPQVACPLNGLELASRRMLRRPALAVQIENHPLARPASNLGSADMVVEATVEGDVTRYTGIYLCNRIRGLVYPVRSGRYYSIDLWQDVRVLPVFFGAGAEAVGRYRAAGMPFVNGISGQWPWFRRGGANPAPHNMHLDIQGLRRDFATDQRLRRLARRVPDLRPPFRFERGPTPDGRPVKHVEIWTNGFWHFGWDWNPRRDLWERSEAGARHVDRATGRVISARSVVVQLVKEDVVFGPHDPGGYPRRYHHLVGSGRDQRSGMACLLTYNQPRPL
ncbi:MAG TPA: DUF3048 domain-containing protein, partial [Pseudonocardiaceae bacterium]|nr:DUF3048 domain-containing protein [Pseudonocardiaceae bacterium]